MSDWEQMEAPLAAIYILGRQDGIWNVHRATSARLGKCRGRPEAGYHHVRVRHLSEYTPEGYTCTRISR